MSTADRRHFMGKTAYPEPTESEADRGYAALAADGTVDRERYHVDPIYHAIVHRIYRGEPSDARMRHETEADHDIETCVQWAITHYDQPLDGDLSARDVVVLSAFIARHLSERVEGPSHFDYPDLGVAAHIDGTDPKAGLKETP